VGVDKAARGGSRQQRPCIVWFTGLPQWQIDHRAAGGHCTPPAATYMLDGDNLPRLNRDIGTRRRPRREHPARGRIASCSSMPA
jgi:adenylylsulfate kinase-like enzyme